MSPAQRSLLFGMIGELAKRHAWGPARRELERERITTAALGAPQSWSICGDSEVDRLKARLRAELEPDNLAAQMTDAAEQTGKGERARLLWRIEKELAGAGLSEGYAVACSRDLYDRAAWRELTLPDLRNLRDVIIRAARSKKRTPGQWAARKARQGKARAKARPAAAAENPF